MAVMKNFDGNEIYIDCYCGCNDGIRFRIDKTDPDLYCFTTYTNGNFYREQSDSIFRVIRKKMKKIWAIIRNKDFYYSYNKHFILRSIYLKKILSSIIFF